MYDTISALVESACRRWPDRVAIYNGTGEEIFFSSLLGTIIAFAEQALERGVQEGDLCAVDMTDPTAGNVLRLALLRLGATVIEGRASGIHRSHELIAKYEFSETAGGDDAPRMAEIQRIFVDPSWIRAPTRNIPISQAGSLVRSTTGTTGTPKLRLVTGKVLAARLQRSSDHRGAPEGPAFIGYKPGSSPSLNHFLRTIISGAPVIQPQATAMRCLDAMHRLSAKVAYLSPYNFCALLEESVRCGVVPGNLERIVVGGGGLHPAIAERGEVQFGCPIINSYGSNETSSIASVRVTETSRRTGVVGCPYPDVEITFKGEDGSFAAPRMGGEIFVRPPKNIWSVSYPDLQEIGDAGGWIATGDIGRMTEDGLLKIAGRVTEMLNVGGNKHAPSYFEDIAMTIPDVARVAAFAIQSETGTDDVGLAVVGRSDFDLTRFAKAMQEKLGSVYTMQIGEVLDLPSNAGGKVDRKRLRQVFLDARNGSKLKKRKERNEGT